MKDKHATHFQGLLIHAHELKKMYLSVRGIPLGLQQTKGQEKQSRTERERKIMRVLCTLLTTGAECGSTSWRGAALPGLPLLPRHAGDTPNCMAAKALSLSFFPSLFAPHLSLF